ncbi:MAG: hypothetical protein SOX94_03960 [Prevotella sp.]|nr:hypothetical protein [Prevotella sp.]
MSRAKGTTAVIAMQIVLVLGELDKTIVGSKAILIRLITAFIGKGDIVGIVVLVGLCPILYNHHTFVQIGFLR